MPVAGSDNSAPPSICRAISPSISDDGRQVRSRQAENAREVQRGILGAQHGIAAPGAQPLGRELVTGKIPRGAAVCRGSQS